MDKTDVYVADETAKAETQKEIDAFTRGYLIACCNIYNMHNEDSIACDVLAEAGITEAEVKKMDLSEYDADALKVIRKARAKDPLS